MEAKGLPRSLPVHGRTKTHAHLITEKCSISSLPTFNTNFKHRLATKTNEAALTMQKTKQKKKLSDSYFWNDRLLAGD